MLTISKQLAYYIPLVNFNQPNFHCFTKHLVTLTFPTECASVDIHKDSSDGTVGHESNSQWAIAMRRD